MHVELTRRTVLLAATLLLVVLDGLWAFDRRQGGWMVWTAYMPDLEQEQREHPRPLFTSEYWDERIPASSVIDPYRLAKPSMLRSFLACHPMAVVVETTEGLPQMPVRYYIYGSNSGLAACAVKSLPRGYRLADREVAPAATHGS
jgi:hypothetical protein